MLSGARVVTKKLKFLPIAKCLGTERIGTTRSAAKRDIRRHIARRENRNRKKKKKKDRKEGKKSRVLGSRQLIDS